jgi:hypothetical protein
LKKNAQPPKQIVPLTEFDDWLASRKAPVFLIVRQADREKLQNIAAARSATIQSLSSKYLGAQLPVQQTP